jgi:addiction module HigA family antidote
MMDRIERQPTTPGEILREEYLVPLEMSQRELAEYLRCDVKVINRIVNGRSAVTASMALKLASAFGTTPEFWLNAQKAVDLYRASQEIGELPPPIRAAG